MTNLALLLASLVLQDPAAAPAATAPAAATAPTTRQFRLTGVPAASRAPLAYEAPFGLIVFKMTVGGREALGLLDTGASRSVVDTRFATATGLAVGTATQTGTTPTGTIEVRLVENVAIGLPGQFDALLPQIGAVDLAVVETTIGRKIDFVLGEDLLSNLSFSVDPGRRTLEFAPPGAAKPSANFPMVELTENGTKLEVMINGKPVKVVMDTGMTRALSLTPEAWARVGSKDIPLTMGSTTSAEGQVHMTDVVKLPAVSIGPVRLQDVESAIRPNRVEDADGTIGMGLLGRTFFIRDRKAGKLWLIPRLPSVVTPPATPPAPTPAPPAG